LKFLTSQPKLPTALSDVVPEAARTELQPDKITSPAVTPVSTAAPPLKNFRRVLIRDMIFRKKIITQGRRAVNPDLSGLLGTRSRITAAWLA
jgi:hypothetical protein